MKARQLASGKALLFEARELARHSDIRMTMRYTHIGLDDQARAVAAIPGPRRRRRQTPLNFRSVSGVNRAANPVICRHRLATR